MGTVIDLRARRGRPTASAQDRVATAVQAAGGQDQLARQLSDELGWRVRPSLVAAWATLVPAPDDVLALVEQITPTVVLAPAADDRPDDHHAYLASIYAHIGHLVALDNQAGGAGLVDTSRRFLAGVQRRLGDVPPERPAGRDLNAAAGELAEVIGWLAYDAEQHDLVRAMNGESLRLSGLAGDRATQWLTLQNASMHAVAQGDPGEGLRIARSVLEGGDRLTPRLRALFLARKARALAAGGDTTAVRILGQVRSLYREGVSDRDPAWAWWVTERELVWHEAMALRDLGRFREALTKFEAAIGPATSRGQYVHRATLLQAQVDVGAWTDAQETMGQLRPLTGEYASPRTVVTVQEACTQITRAASAPGGIQEAATDLAALATAVCQ